MLATSKQQKVNTDIFSTIKQVCSEAIATNQLERANERIRALTEELVGAKRMIALLQERADLADETARTLLVGSSQPWNNLYSHAPTNQ